MTDRIDPGPGWRLLKPKEIVKEGDERRDSGGWVKSSNAGLPQSPWSAYRRRTAPRTTKAIATRATVRIAFTDCVVDRTISQPGGLRTDSMDAIATHFADRAKAYQGAGVAKYIMLEIQREGEP